MNWNRVVAISALILMVGVSLVSLMGAAPAVSGSSARAIGGQEQVLQAEGGSPGQTAKAGTSLEEMEEWNGDDFMEAPRRVVARLIRVAMMSPENEAAWAKLAATLPELSSDEEAQSPSMLRAAQIADSVAGAVAGSSSDAMTTAGSGGSGPAWAAPIGNLFNRAANSFKSALKSVFGAAVDEDWFGLTVLLTPLLAFLLLRGIQAGSPKSRNRGPREQTAASSQAETESVGSLDAARALSSSGLPPCEVARRTGIAQDALTVMAALGRSPGQ